MYQFSLLASYSFIGGGAFGDLLTRWEQMGFFSYVLPFLLIFSIVFGVLIKTRIFEDNKSINAIIAIAVGFLSLQWDLVPRFFSEVFPRAGVGLSIVLIAILFLGMFLPGENWTIFLVLGAIIVAVVLFGSFGELGWQIPIIGNLDFGNILPVILVLGAIIAIVVGASKFKSPGGWGPPPGSVSH